VTTGGDNSIDRAAAAKPPSSTTAWKTRMVNNLSILVNKCLPTARLFQFHELFIANAALFPRDNPR
jgi:hypothetical protein